MMVSRPPGTQHNDAHSMIFAMCVDRPSGNPTMPGSDAKIAVSQARPAINTSMSCSSARWNELVPIWATKFVQASTAASVSAGMPSTP